MALEETRGTYTVAAPPSEQQIQQLCRCCPAVESLVFELPIEATAAVLLPLQQLSALTHLQVNTVEDVAVVEAVIAAIAQLTGLKHLALPSSNEPSWATPAAKADLCAPLTALTALQQLDARFQHSVCRVMHFKNEASALRSRHTCEVRPTLPPDST
jgi:hypothetical protein